MFEEKLKEMNGKKLSDKEAKVIADLVKGQSEVDILDAVENLKKESKKNSITKLAKHEVFIRYRDLNRVIVPDWMSKLNEEQTKDLIQAHDIIREYCQGHTQYPRFNQALLNKLWYFNSQKIPFHSQIEVFKRNISDYNRDKNDDDKMMSVFEPEDLFIEQCRVAYKIYLNAKERFLGKDMIKALEEKVININEVKK